MVYDLRKFVQNANAAKTNQPGTCLMTVRTWAGIASRYPDAATAWRNTNDRHPGDKTFPEGCFVYWTGGSHGYGHIAAGLTKNRIRSTDCTTSGHVSTVDVDWVENHWGLTYAGWSWDCNEVTMPHSKRARA